ncbi:glycosyltransferase [Candidatus Sumerlaeota bacterium]|nr:glycosyltransferase [Candidatus Sumerlaeota bacterium]
MMRVLFLSNMCPSDRWPAYGTFVEAHIAALRRSGEVDLTVCAITDPRKGLRTAVKYLNFTLRSWLRSLGRRFDLVHVHYAYPTIIGARIALMRGAKLVITAHGGDVNEMLARRAPDATRRALRRADHLIAVSGDIAAKLRENLGDDCPEISVRNMGVDLKRFVPASDRRPCSEGEPAHLLCVSRLVERKGVDVLLRAVARLRLPWRLDVIGVGPERRALGDLAWELGLADRVVFHGALPPEQLPRHYQGADLFVGPTLQEAVGQVFLEAAACGCPIVATRVGGIPEILCDGESALLVAPGDAEALAEAIERCLRDPVLRCGLIERGLAVARENSQARSIEHTLDIYRALIAS